MFTSHVGVLSLGRATGAAVPFKTSTFDNRVLVSFPKPERFMLYYPPKRKD